MYNLIQYTGDWNTSEANLLGWAVLCGEKRDIVPLINKTSCELAAMNRTSTLLMCPRIHELLRFTVELGKGEPVWRGGARRQGRPSRRPRRRPSSARTRRLARPLPARSSLGGGGAGEGWRTEAPGLRRRGPSIHTFRPQEASGVEERAATSGWFVPARREVFVCIPHTRAESNVHVFNLTFFETLRFCPLRSRIWKH